MRQKLGDQTSPIGKLVQPEAERLAEIITQSHKGKEVRPISYFLREVVRNSFEHGQTTKCNLAAQRYTNRTEISIVDCGQGVRQSLARRFNVRSDIDALKLAIKPGISGAEPVPDNELGEWANSGFGLFVLSEVGKRTGSFMICSGSRALVLSAQSVGARDYRFQGTAVRLSISKPPGSNFEDFINQIINEGERIAAKSGTLRRASKSTSSL